MNKNYIINLKIKSGWNLILFLRAMKITVALLLVIISQSIASVGFSQKLVSLNLRNVKLEKVLDQIEKQSDLYFVFNQKLVNVSRTVNLSVKNKDIKEVLDELFAGVDVNYRVLDKQILLAPGKYINPINNETTQKQIKISGVVVDAKGITLPGVTIKIKGTSIGITTDGTGKFNLNVPSGKTILTVSCIGYISQDIIVGNQQLLTIILQDDIKKLDEVVVVGYGTQKRENLTGAISTISSTVFSDKIASSPANLLQGKITGVTAIQSSGGAPGMSASIKIREASSWMGSSAPLFVIDGMILDENAFKRLNPNDIDNISILKDAASAAIYGMKAGNGVVLVTTKSGSKQRSTITYNVSYQNSSPANLLRPLNAYDAALVTNQYSIQSGRGSSTEIATPDELEYFKTHSWYATDALRNPINKTHNLSLSGGSEKIKYYISGSYYNEKPMFYGDFSKYSMLAKLEGEIREGLTFSLSMNGTWGKTNQGFWGYYKGEDSMTQLFRQVIYAPTNIPSEINGKYNLADNAPTAFTDGTFGSDKRSDMRINPALEIKYSIPQVKGLSVKAGLKYLDYKKDYKEFGYSPENVYAFKTTGQHNHIYTDEVDVTQGDNGAFVGSWLAASMQGNSEALYQGYEYTHSYQINADVSYLHQFGKHDLQAMVGYEQISSKGEYENITTYGFPNLNYQYIDGSLGSSDEKKRFISGNAGGLNGQVSYYGRLNYNYDQRYLLGITARADGTYVFSPDKRFGYFPAVSIGWNIARESFFEPIRKIADEVKLRVSYGLTGSINTDPWQWQQSYNYTANSGILLGNGLVSGMGLGSTINPDITWEKNLNFDIGLDVSFLNKMFTLTTDYWHKKTYDILASRIASIPNTVGASLPAVNYGKAAAGGFEIALQHNGKIGELNYNVGGNWAISSNKFLLVDQAAAVRDYQNIIGHPINGVLWGYVCEGVIEDQAQVDKILAENGKNFTILGMTPRPGMLMYKDLRGPLGTDTPDGKVDGNDMTRITTNNVPRITYGFNLNAEWKGLELGLSFAGVAKYEIYTGGDWTARNFQAKAVYPMWKNYWTPENTNATMPSPAAHNWGGYGQNIEVPSTFWIKSGNFLRLKNVTLSYTLPKEIIAKTAPISNVKIYLSGDNLFLFSKLWRDWGMDPELGGNVFNYPIMKSLTAGISVTF
jgi:TonB-linked SusC/RagA family outer membrane protein